MSSTIEDITRNFQSVGKRIYKVYIDYGTTSQPFFESIFVVDEKYEIVEVLGSGSFALVCLATDTSNGEDVAIKKLEDIFRHELYVERVIREVVIHSQISHPFVVTLKGIMRPDNEYRFKDIYLVMESMEQSLHYILVKQAQQEDGVGDGVGELLDGDLNVKLIMSQVTFKTSFFYHN